MMFDFDENYWTDRYQKGYTGWDIGYPSTPIVQYLDQIQNKNLSILIPGAGNAHEAAYAFNSGLKNTHILDISSIPLENFKSNFPDFDREKILKGDFFEHSGSYDLILEQTFFCALPPQKRVDYCKKMQDLLSPEGRLVGVLFGVEFDRPGPPFGGSIENYQNLFSNYFTIETLEPCVNSIPARQGTEVFVSLAL